MTKDLCRVFLLPSGYHFWLSNKP